MEVQLVAAVRSELAGLPEREREALLRALEKLEAAGPLLAFPHSSAVKSSAGLRELRPRRGSSPWRAFYRRLGDCLVVAAIGPEATVDHRGFLAAVRRAETRLAALEDDGG